MDKAKLEVECCANCKNCVAYPKNNRYGDVDYMCLISGYYISGVHKDRNKVRRFTPGGRELECRYEKELCVAKRLPNCRTDRLEEDTGGQLRFA